MKNSSIHLRIDRPASIPSVVLIRVDRSVVQMKKIENGDGDTSLLFSASPIISHQGTSKRRLMFSYSLSPKPMPDWPFVPAGEVELDRRKVYLLLERGR